MLAAHRNASSSAAVPLPPWVHRVINLATPGTQRLGALFNKLKLFAEWLRRHPDVSDERLVVFVDAMDVVWGGCTDFAARFEALERSAGARVVVSAELNCGGATAEPPGCTGTPPPPAWAVRAAGPMLDTALSPWLHCRPAGAPRSVCGAARRHLDEFPRSP